MTPRASSASRQYVDATARLEMPTLASRSCDANAEEPDHHCDRDIQKMCRDVVTPEASYVASQGPAHSPCIAKNIAWLVTANGAIRQKSALV